MTEYDQIMAIAAKDWFRPIPKTLQPRTVQEKNIHRPNSSACAIFSWPRIFPDCTLFLKMYGCFCREELHDSEVFLLTKVLNLSHLSVNPVAREEGTNKHMNQNFTVNARLWLHAILHLIVSSGSERGLGLAWTSWTAGPAWNKRR